MISFFARSASEKARAANAKRRGHKQIFLSGATYTIRRLSRMPALFSAEAAARLRPASHVAEMIPVITAGLVSPVLVPAGKGEAKGREDGITVEDLFRDPSHGLALFREIMIHSLNPFSGLKGFFFHLKLQWTFAAVSVEARRARAAGWEG